MKILSKRHPGKAVTVQATKITVGSVADLMIADRIGKAIEQSMRTMITAAEMKAMIDAVPSKINTANIVNTPVEVFIPKEQISFVDGTVNFVFPRVKFSAESLATFETRDAALKENK